MIARAARLVRHFAVIALATVALAATAAAQEQSPAPDPDVRARELYLRGDRSYAEGDYEGAIQAFRESYRLSGRPLLLYNLANAYERLGRYEEALSSLRAYAPHAGVEEESLIRRRIESLEQRADEQRDADRRGGESGDGGETGVSHANGTGTGATTTAPPPPTPTRPPPSDDGAAISPAVWLLLGGSVAVGAGVVFAALASAARDDAGAHCRDTASTRVCDVAAEDALARDRTYSILADVSFVLGVGAAAAGIAWLVLDDSSSAPGSAAAPRVTAGVRPGGAEVGVLGRF